MIQNITAIIQMYGCLKTLSEEPKISYIGCINESAITMSSLTFAISITSISFVNIKKKDR